MATSVALTKATYGNGTYTGYGAASSTDRYVSVMRLKFVAPATGAKSYSVAIRGCSGGTQGSDVSNVKLVYKITEDAIYDKTLKVGSELPYDGQCNVGWINTTTTQTQTGVTITRDENGNITHIEGVMGTAATGGEVAIAFSGEMDLIPGKTYYIWIYPKTLGGGNIKTSTATNLFIYLDGNSGGIVNIYAGGEWKQAMPYIYTNGEWKQAAAYIYSNGEWHNCG